MQSVLNVGFAQIGRANPTLSASPLARDRHPPPGPSLDAGVDVRRARRAAPRRGITHLVPLRLFADPNLSADLAIVVVFAMMVPDKPLCPEVLA